MDEENDSSVAPTPEASTAPEPFSLPAEPAFETVPLDAWQKIRQLALRQLDRFVSLEPKVLQGDDVDAIHDIRVASRRLQQVLDLIYSPPPREMRKLRRKIRRCRRALGEVRNCDVLAQRVERVLASKRTSRREIWEAIRHYLRQRRAESFQQGVRKLSRVNLAGFYVRLREHLDSGGVIRRPGHLAPPSDPATELAPEHFYERIDQSLDRVWQAFEAQLAQSERDPRAPVFHGVRIAAKRVRYLIEVIHAFGVPGSADTLAWLRNLQQHLGDWHDLEVLEQMMIEMVARPEFLREHLEIAMGAEKLILRNRALKKGYEEKYFRITLDSAGFRRVKEWVDYVRSSPSAAFAKA